MTADEGLRISAVAETIAFNSVEAINRISHETVAHIREFAGGNDNREISHVGGAERPA